MLFRAVKELGRRYGASRTSVEDIVDSTRAAREVFAPLFYGARNEMVFLLCMDGKGKYLGCPKVGEGNVNAAEITARSIVEAALNHNAARVILAHNHVSGLALPSEMCIRDSVKGTSINLIADGPDEKEAVEALVELIASNFSE